MTSSDFDNEIAAVRRDARLVRSAEQVQAAIADMAERINARLADKHPVVVAVMHGGVFAAVNLCRHFSFPYEFDYVHLSRYRKSLEGGELDWHVPPRPDLTDRVVLVVDDVLDHGTTLAEVCKSLRRLKVAELYTGVLVSKDVDESMSRPAVDFVGIQTEDVYLFGCGMDYKGHWRGLPALYAPARP